jgi:hypothetical protein
LGYVKHYFICCCGVGYVSCLVFVERLIVVGGWLERFKRRFSGKFSDLLMDFGVAILSPILLKGISGWFRKTALLFTKPMINTQRAVSTRNCRSEALPRQGRTSQGHETAIQGGENIARHHRTTSGVHQDAFFAPHGDPGGRLRRCFQEAIRETLKELQGETASLSHGKRQRAARRGCLVWAEFIHLTKH